MNDSHGKIPLQPDISLGNKIWGMTGITMIQYARVFNRKNLFGINESRSKDNAKLNAYRILKNVNSIDTDTFIICLGKEVATAFGLYTAMPLKFKKIQTKTWAAYLPYESEFNRRSSLSERRLAATEFMQSVGAAAIGEISEDDLHHHFAQ